MKKGGHYDASGLIEAQFEPGSRGRVLRNLLGIKSKREMDQVEAREQLRTLEELVRIYDQTHRFAAANQIPRLMMELEKGPLREYTPCRFTGRSEIAIAIAVVHTELLLIHPF
jgi:cell filamentation protein